MPRKTLPNTQPGEVLLEAIYKPLHISQNRLARAMGVAGFMDITLQWAYSDANRWVNRHSPRTG